MSDILNQALSLSLNAHWAPVGVRSLRDAVTFLCSESHGEPPGFALDIELDEKGDLVFANPLPWDQWVELPVRPNDLYIQTAHSKIRAPLVTVARFFDRMPFRRPRLSNGAIFERDKGVCQYTGRKLPRSQLNVDHVVPRDRGGRDTWENMVLADKSINSAKSNRLNHEIGLRLIREPKAPPSLPVSATITEVRRPEWKPFLTHLHSSK